MTFSAGSIESTLDVDRTPFQRGLAAAKREGEDFAKQKFTAKIEVNADTAKAKRDVRDFRTEASHGGPIKIEVNADTTKARTEVAALRQQVNSVGTDAKKAGADGEASFNLMADAALLLGPALIPLAGGIAGISSGAVGMGLDLILAVKGASAEMKAGTATGLAYASSIAVAKRDVAGLEQTAAKGVLKSFQSEVDKLNASMPQLNEFIEKTSGTVGSIAAKGADSLLNIFTAAEPLIMDAEGALDKMFTRLDNWSGGDGAKEFFQTLDDDIPIAVDTLGNLVSALSNVIEAAAPIGGVTLGVINDLASGIAKIPTPLLTALIGALTLWRVQALGAALSSKILGTAAASTGAAVAVETEEMIAARAATLSYAEALNLLAASQARAGAAGAVGGAGALRGAAGAGMGRTAMAGLTKAGIYGAAAYLGTGFADQQTKGWQTSNNPIEFGIGNAFHSANNLLHGDFSGAWNDAVGNVREAKTGKQQADTIYALTHDSGVDQLFGGAKGALGQTYDPNRAAIGGVISGHGSIDRTTQAQQVAGGVTPGAATAIAGAASKAASSVKELTNAEVENAASAKAYSTVNDMITSSFKATDDAAGKLDVNKAADSYKDLAGNLQKTATAQQKWLTQAGPTHGVINGMAVSEKTWSDALKETNGDQVKAVGLISGRVDALGDSNRAVADAKDREEHLTTAISMAGTKYKLTADQVGEYASVLGISSEKVADGTISADHFSTAIGQAAKAISNGSSAVAGWVAAIDTFNSSADTAASRGALIGAAMVAANGDAISFQNTMVQGAVANQKLVDDFNNLGKGIFNVKTGMLDFHNAGAAPVLGDLANLQTAAMNSAAAVYQHEQSLHMASAADDAFSTYVNGTRGALVKQASQMGLTKGEAKNLANEYFNIKNSGDLKKQIELIGQDKVNAALQGILTDLDAIAIRHPKPKVDADTLEGKEKLQEWQNEVDALHGKTVYIDTVMRGKASAPGAAKGLDATYMGGIYNAYAAGGFEKHTPQIAIPGANRVRVWAEPETKGEAYIPLANDWRRPRAQEIAAETAHRLGGVAFFASGGETGGFTGVTGTGKTGTGGSSGSGGSSSAAKKKGLSKSDTAFNAMLAAFVGTSSAPARDLASDYSALAGIASQSISQVKAALHNLNIEVSAIRSKGLTSKGVVQDFQHENAALLKAVTNRQNIITSLANYKTGLANVKQAYSSEYQTVRGAVMGSFDAGTSGNGYQSGILSSLKSDVTDASKFQSLRAQAVKLGLNANALKQITEEGPEAAGDNLQAIVKGGSSFVKQYNSQYSQLEKLSGSIATSQAKDTYGKTMAADTKKIKDLTADLKRYNIRVANDTSAIRKDITRLRAELKSKKRTK